MERANRKSVNDKVIPLTRGEAIDYLTKGLDYDND